MADEPIPSTTHTDAAKWLTEQLGENDLTDVVGNGPTALFWYIASLLASYKEQS